MKDGAKMLPEIKKALELCDQEDYHAAHELLQEISNRISQNDDNFFAARGRALGGMNKPNEALEDLERAIDINSRHVEAINALGRLYYEMGQYSTASDYYKKALEIDHNNTKALKGLGDTLDELKQYEEALEYYRTALEIKPDAVNVLNNIGNTLNNLDRREEAVESYHKALEIEPDDVETLYNIGCVLNYMKRSEEALVYFRRALKISPNNTNALNGLGATLDDLEQFEEALACYKSALEIKPDAADVLNNIGVTLDNLKRYEEALAYYQRALKTSPNDSAALKNIGITYTHLKKYKEAHEYFKRAQKTAASNTDNAINSSLLADIWAGKGLLYENTRNYDMAYSSYKEAYENKPDNIGVQLSLERMEKNLAADTHIEKKDTSGKEEGEIKNTDSIGEDEFEWISAFHDDPKHKRIAEAIIIKKESFATFTVPRAKIEREKSFLVLRRWNSYSPIVGRRSSSSKGGGYYLQTGECGIVIDPGFNFIENFQDFAYSFVDIDKVFITHAHNDHVSDLESILSLLYRYNKDVKEMAEKEHTKVYEEKIRALKKNELGQNACEEQGKQLEKEKDEAIAEEIRTLEKHLDLYMTASTFKKYANFLELKKSNPYTVHVIDKDSPAIDCGGDVFIKPVYAKHDDILSNVHAVGFKIIFPRFVLLYTGDSGYCDDLEREYEVIKKECETKNVPLVLLAHIGGFHNDEEKAANEKKESEKGRDYRALIRSRKAFYGNHLGRNGIILLAKKLKPEYVILSEFGEEFKGNRIALANLFTGFFKKRGMPIHFLPSDIGFRIDENYKIAALNGIKRVSASLSKTKKEFLLLYEYLSHSEVKAFSYKDGEIIHIISKSQSVDNANSFLDSFYGQ